MADLRSISSHDIPLHGYSLGTVEGLELGLGGQSCERDRLAERCREVGRDSVRQRWLKHLRPLLRLSQLNKINKNRVQLQTSRVLCVATNLDQVMDDVARLVARGEERRSCQIRRV